MEKSTGRTNITVENVKHSFSQFENSVGEFIGVFRPNLLAKSSLAAGELWVKISLNSPPGDN